MDDSLKKNLVKITRTHSSDSYTGSKSVRTSLFTHFDKSFEYGYGEDKDYGMQLRLAGCDIIYHPDLEILHLKAPRGGFRQTTLPPWEKDRPKPSPTLMLYAKKYYSREQFLGFKTELFLRYYSKQPLKNPYKYLKQMQKRWKASEAWAEKLKTAVKNNQT